jgi:hypothetical protein
MKVLRALPGARAAVQLWDVFTALARSACLGKQPSEEHAITGMVVSIYPNHGHGDLCEPGDLSSGRSRMLSARLTPMPVQCTRRRCVSRCYLLILQMLRRRQLSAGQAMCWTYGWTVTACHRVTALGRTLFCGMPGAGYPSSCFRDTCWHYRVFLSGPCHHVHQLQGTVSC